MNIIKPYARILPPPTLGFTPEKTQKFLLADGIDLLRHVEWCARISHRSEDAVTLDSYDRLLRSVVLNHGDWSVTEHASVSVDFLVDRGITHEIVRHRLFAFTQESTRFVNYAKKILPSFICPEEIEKVALGMWSTTIEAVERTYEALIKMGLAPQLARSVFPNALASRLIVTGNLRNWRHFLIARTTKQCHPQMLEVTIPLLKEFQDKIPILYEDIIPLQSQKEAFSKPR